MTKLEEDKRTEKQKGHPPPPIHDFKTNQSREKKSVTCEKKYESKQGSRKLISREV